MNVSKEHLMEAISSNLINITSKGMVSDERDYNQAKNMSLDIINLFGQAINTADSKEDIVDILLETFEDMKSTNLNQFKAKAQKANN